MARLGVMQLAGVCTVIQSPAESPGWKHNNVPSLRCWPPLVGARAGSKRLAEPSGELQTTQVLSREVEKPVQPEGNKSTASDSGLWPADCGELQARSNSYRGNFSNKRQLVVDYVTDALRPLLERLGLSIVKSPHGQTKASFAIIEQRELAACAQGESILCLPVHVKAGSFYKGTGQVHFSGLLGQPGLVLLVDTKTCLTQSSLSEALEAAHLFTGRSIMSQTISLRPGAPSKYAPHKVVTAEELVHTTVDFASRVFGMKEGPLRTVVKGGAVLSVSDVLPLPPLQQVTTPTAENDRKALAAYDAFFGTEGLLAGPMMQGLLTVDRKQASRTGYFMLVCKLESKAAQLTAFGCLGSLQSQGGVRFRTCKDGQSKAQRWTKPFLAGEVDISVCYTPCLSGIYLIPDFALAQRGVRSTEQAPGQTCILVRPYGGGRGRAKVWNRFLVDCTAPEDEVYARCRALLALAAEGKVKGWEAMPPAEELRLAPVTLPPPQQAAKQRKEKSF